VSLALAGFALIVPFVFPVGVLARQVLATVTSTFIPPSPSPTPFDASCPVGTPAGWGTYTPSPLWSVECGACAVIVTPTLTLTPSPVPTWSGIGTPPATGTGTPLATVTGTPLVTATPFLDNISLFSSPSFQLWPMNWTSVETITGNSFSCSDNGDYIHCSGVISLDDPVDNQDDFFVITLPLLVPASSNVYSKINLYGSMGWDNSWWGSNDSYALVGYSRLYSGTDVSFHPASFTSVNSYNPIMYSSRYMLAHNVGDSDGMVPMYLRLGHLGSAGHTWSGSFTYDWTISLVPDFLTPTPSLITPTPTSLPVFDTGYCSSIAPPLSDFGFDLFVPDGEPYCELGWEAFEAGTVTMPKVKICFQPSAFGVITMFSYDYEVGTLGLAIAAAFIWRFMRTV
jgi:hypothetical protein